MKRVLAISTLLVTAACVQTPTDPAKGPVILQCDGSNTISTLDDSSNSQRNIYRIDGIAKTFEVWNDKKADWNKWGDDQTLSITANQIDFMGGVSGEGAFARRHTSFDRLNGTVTDEITVFPMGKTSFRGLCEAVAKPTEAKQKF